MCPSVCSEIAAIDGTVPRRFLLRQARFLRSRESCHVFLLRSPARSWNTIAFQSELFVAAWRTAVHGRAVDPAGASIHNGAWRWIFFRIGSGKFYGGSV